MSDPGSDSESDGLDALAFPNVFRRLSQRAAAGGRGRSTHAPVPIPGDFFAHVVPATNEVTLDRVLRAVWADAWVACAGELLPIGLVIREIGSGFADGGDIGTVVDRAAALNRAKLDAVPDILGCCVIPNATASSLPISMRRWLHPLWHDIGHAFGSTGQQAAMPGLSGFKDFDGRKTFVLYVHEHAAHMPLPLNTSAPPAPYGVNSPNNATPSVATLDKISARIMVAAKTGGPLGLHGDFALGGIGLTRQRRKVLRNVLVAERPLAPNVIRLGLDELYADYDLLAERDHLRQEAAALLAKNQAKQQGKAQHRDPNSTNSPPPAPMIRHAVSKQDLRGRPLDAQLDWASDDDDDDAPPDPAAMEEFVISRQESRARVGGTGDHSPSNAHDDNDDNDTRGNGTGDDADNRAAAEAGGGDSPSGVHEPFSNATRHLSTVSLGEDDEFVPIFSRAADCTMRVRCACCECAKTIASSGYHMAVTSCTGGGTHVVCADCLNHRVSDLIAHGFVDLNTLPCTRDDCFGDHVFDDFAGLMSPIVRRFWCREAMKAESDRVTRDVQQRLDAAAARPSAAASRTDEATQRAQREALL